MSNWYRDIVEKLNEAAGGLDEFTIAYIEAMLHADMNYDSQRSDDKALDRKLQSVDFDSLGIDDIDPDSLKQMIEDCAKFEHEAGEQALEEYGVSQAGYDFWMTRNGHGVGFWEEDHGTPEICKHLDHLAKQFGNVNGMFDVDSGRIYVG